jgi:N6-adenosine-specific RNA methylase IME4
MKWIKELTDMSVLEWLAVVATILATIYYMSYWGFNYKSIAICALLMVFGYMSANMIYDMWFGRR